MIIATSSFLESSVFKMYSVRTKMSSNSSGLTSVSEKLQFYDGFVVWPVRLTLEINLHL